MTIRFACPKCTKLLKVADSWAGKQGKCPRCMNAIPIPARQPTLDVEVVAAAAFAAEQAAGRAAAKAAATRAVKFTCSYCDEEQEVSAEHAGKQMPCPACGRIVKVPTLAKEEAKDWRKVERGLGALRKDNEPAPEGEWGTVTASAHVSRSALEEAEAIPVIKEEAPSGSRVLLGVAAGLAVAGAVLLVVAGKHLWDVHNQQDALAKALAFVPENGRPLLRNLPAAEAYRAMGDFYLRSGNASKARRALLQANQLVSQDDSGSLERDATVIDLAGTEAELGGGKEEVMYASRIPWDQSARDLLRTVNLVRSPEGRAEAIRTLSRSLIARGQNSVAETLARAVPVASERERPELLAILALERLAAGHPEAAKTLAASVKLPAIDPPGTSAAKSAAAPLPGPIQLAVLAASDTGKAEKLTKTTVSDAKKDPYPEVRIGYSCGLAHQGKWDDALAIAGSPGAAEHRLAALVGVADVAMPRDMPSARRALEQAMDAAGQMVKERPDAHLLPPWLFLRLVRLGWRAGMPEEKLRPLADALPKDRLRDRAQLELLRGRLAGLDRADSETLDKESKQPTSPQVLELICRHNARYDSSATVLRAIDRLEPKTLQVFGYIGVALGEQESGR